MPITYNIVDNVDKDVVIDVTQDEYDYLKSPEAFIKLLKGPHGRIKRKYVPLVEQLFEEHIDTFSMDDLKIVFYLLEDNKVVDKYVPLAEKALHRSYDRIKAEQKAEREARIAKARAGTGLWCFLDNPIRWFNNVHKNPIHQQRKTEPLTRTKETPLGNPVKWLFDALNDSVYHKVTGRKVDRQRHQQRMNSK